MLRFHELAPSPNNIKIRLALEAKQIPFEAVAVDPRDRSDLLQVSGQELSPVIEDKGIVLNDSEAILHYLDANYRDGPRIWPSDRAGRRACDAWRDAVYETVVPASGALFMSSIKLRDPASEADREAFRAACGWAQEQLADGQLKDLPWPVCSIWLASWLCYAWPSEPMVTRVKLFQTIAETYATPAGSFPALEGWLADWTARL